MLKKTTFLLQLATLIILTSRCNSEKSGIEFTLSESNLFKVELDSLTSPIIHSLNTYKRNGIQYLAFQNYGRLGIVIYDLDQKKLIRRIEFQKEGPNGIGSLDGFYMHTPDSIFVLSAHKYQVILCDGSGSIIRKYSVMKSKIGDNTVLPRVSNVSPMTIIADSLYVPGTPDNYSPEPNDKIYNNMISLNIKSGDFTYCNTMPKIYKTSWWGNTHALFCYTRVENEFVYSYAISDSLEIVKSRYTKSKYAGSDRFGKITPMTTLTTDFNANADYLFRTPIYVGVVYDKFREVYYRVAQQPLEKEFYNDALTGNLKRRESIIILDKNFNKIGEKDIEFDKYITYEFFVLEDGLCLPLKSKTSDDEKAFAILKLEKI